MEEVLRMEGEIAPYPRCGDPEFDLNSRFASLIICLFVTPAHLDNRP